MKRILASWKYIVVVVGLAVLTLLVIDFNQRLTTWRETTAERNKVEADYNALISTQSYYQTQIAYATSPAAVMEWAYRDGRWVRDNEVLVVPLPAGEATPEPSATEVSAPPPPANWQLWWALFFDSPAP